MTIEPHGLCLHYVPTKVLNKDFFSAAEPPERSQRSGTAQASRNTTNRTNRTNTTNTTARCYRHEATATKPTQLSQWPQ